MADRSDRYARPVRSRWGWLAVLVLVGLAAACGSGTGASPGEPAATTPAPSAATSATAATTAATTGPATAASTTTTAALPTAAVSTTTTVAELPRRAGVQQLHFEVGPFDIQPGQNNIDYTSGIPQPAVDGWIVGIRPEPPPRRRHDAAGRRHPPAPRRVAEREPRQDATAPGCPSGSSPPARRRPITDLPARLRLPRTRRRDHWLLNYMLHNLLPKPDAGVDHLRHRLHPGRLAGGRRHRARAPDLDGRAERRDLPRVRRHPGRRAPTASTPTPTTPPIPYAGGQPANEWTVDRDGVLVGHRPATCTPAACTTISWRDRVTATRRARPASTSRRADYYEPAGAVSWDVAMSATPPDWRGRGARGRRAVDVTPPTTRPTASWYESMGIMVVWMADGSRRPAGADPFTTDVDVAGVLTHGHLPENDNHGGAAGRRPRPRPHPGPVRGRRPARSPIADFVYVAGRHELADPVPDGQAGQSITLQQRRRTARQRHLAHDHRVQGAVRRSDRHRLSRSPTPTSRSTPASSASAGPPTAGRIDVVDPDRPARRHLHLLLPDPPVHAGRVPRRRRRRDHPELTKRDERRGSCSAPTPSSCRRTTTRSTSSRRSTSAADRCCCTRPTPATATTCSSSSTRGRTTSPTSADGRPGPQPATTLLVPPGYDGDVPDGGDA